MKYLAVITLLFLSLLSCKEKEIIKDSCTNGFLDPGETKIDCGGKCKPCPVTYYPEVNLIVNGKSVTFNKKSLTYANNTYILNCSNDTLDFKFNLGNVSTLGINTQLVSPGTTALYKGSFYDNIVSNNSVVLISSHDTSASRMSGLINAQFYKPGQNDVLYVTGGSFTDMSY